jgi:hypothetical protein
MSIQGAKTVGRVSVEFDVANYVDVVNEIE